MKNFIIIFFLLFSQNALSEDVYRWIDNNGVSHYGDASKIKDKKSGEYYNVTENSKKNNYSKVANYIPNPINIKKYEVSNLNYSLQLISPNNNEDIEVINGILPIVVGIKPIPTKGYSLKVYLDNSLYKSVNNSSKIEINAVAQGEHEIFVKMQMSDGKIITSDSIKVNIIKNIKPK